MAQECCPSSIQPHHPNLSSLRVVFSASSILLRADSDLSRLQTLRRSVHRFSETALWDSTQTAQTAHEGSPPTHNRSSDGRHPVKNGESRRAECPIVPEIQRLGLTLLVCVPALAAEPPAV